MAHTRWGTAHGTASVQAERSYRLRRCPSLRKPIWGRDADDVWPQLSRRYAVGARGRQSVLAPQDAEPDDIILRHPRGRGCRHIHSSDHRRCPEPTFPSVRVQLATGVNHVASVALARGFRGSCARRQFRRGTDVLSPGGADSSRLCERGQQKTPHVQSGRGHTECRVSPTTPVRQQRRRGTMGIRALRCAWSDALVQQLVGHSGDVVLCLQRNPRRGIRL